MSDKNITVGSYGWRHPHWRGSFYPEDLPEDWQLSYYSNEFSVVMVTDEDNKLIGALNLQDLLRSGVV